MARHAYRTRFPDQQWLADGGGLWEWGRSIEPKALHRKFHEVAAEIAADADEAEPTGAGAGGA